MRYQVLKPFSHEPQGKPPRVFEPGEEIDPEKLRLKLPIEWLLAEGAIEEVKEGTN